MKDNDKITKFANNKKILYIAPNLTYINTILTRYLINKDIFYFENIIILILMLIMLTAIIQLILKKILKKDQLVFYIATIISMMYMCQYNLKFILLFIISGLGAYIVTKIALKEYINTFISIALFIIIFNFFLGVPQNIFTITKNAIKTEKYKDSTNIYVEQDTKTPNIYWIHADAMMNFETIQKYFHYSNLDLRRYLKQEDFQINETASLVVGNKTQNALAALYNPNYYDNHFKKYLYELEEVNLENKKNTSFNISTKEMAQKRLNSELLTSLKKKDYTTIAISKLNNYSTLNTDIFYDFYNHSKGHWHFTETEELRKLTDKSIENIKKTYRLNQFKEILSFSLFSKLATKLIPYEYELINYNKLDTSNYETINNTEYWQIKAIVKSLEETKKIESKKFVFIDYDLNHTQLSFDILGNKLESYDYMNIERYIENYIYAYKILIDLVDYIKDIDSDGIIIIQADHGLHTFDDEYLAGRYGTDIKGVREIRNSVMNAIYIPEQYQNGEEEYLNNPLNISRYIVNNYVGKNYEYLEY